MASETATKTAHGFVFKSIEGEHLPLSSFSGKAVLIVNTASHCGFTRQLAKTYYSRARPTSHGPLPCRWARLKRDCS